jgi:hypothetical protein
MNRPTLRKPDRSSDQDNLAPPKGQTRPIEQRFHLKVDGQFKSSFGSEEAAKTAGTAIKKAYPVVVVTVVAGTQNRSDQRLTFRAPRCASHSRCIRVTSQCLKVANDLPGLSC